MQFAPQLWDRYVIDSDENDDFNFITFKHISLYINNDSQSPNQPWLPNMECR